MAENQSFIEKMKARLGDVWETVTQKSDEDGMSGIGRERIIVFAISVLLAFSIWLIVSLNKDHSVKIEVPIVMGNTRVDQALVEELPKTVTASISGNGWSLLNIYESPPRVYIDVTQPVVNMFDQIRNQIRSVSDVSVQTVDPLSLELNFESKISKKVPVQPNVEVNFHQQFAFLTPPVLHPDSIVVTGAASRVQKIDAWPTVPLRLDGVREDIRTEVGLKASSSTITISEEDVQYRARVAEFTEARHEVPVEMRDFPNNVNITFSPRNVTLVYELPISEYNQFEGESVFSAYVNYEQIQQDTSGFVDVRVEKIRGDAHANFRKAMPPKVGYFTIIDN